MKKEREEIASKGKRYIITDRYKEVVRSNKKKGKNCNVPELAAVACVSDRQFQNYTAGRTPIDESSLIKLCKYLDVSPDYLTNENEEYLPWNRYTNPFYLKIKTELREDYAKKILFYEYLREFEPDLYENACNQLSNGLVDNERDALIEEIRSAIRYASERFILNIIEARKRSERKKQIIMVSPEDINKKNTGEPL